MKEINFIYHFLFLVGKKLKSNIPISNFSHEKSKNLLISNVINIVGISITTIFNNIN
jgi:hypothetical protein